MGLGSLFKRKKKEVVDESHIVIDESQCEGCEKCCIACPNNVFVIDEDVSKVRNHQVCKNCKVCIAICPNNCITVN